MKRNEAEGVLILNHIPKALKEGKMAMKRLLIVLFLMMGFSVLTVHPVIAEQFQLFGGPANLMGYVTQGVGFSLVNDNKLDTQKGLQSSLMNLFVEGDYAPVDNLKFYGSSMLTVDWAYQLLKNDSQWTDKEFDKSDSKLNFDSKYWQIIKEAHLTWTPGNFLFRAGKQIVAWGETDGFRLMDQINPVDGRRGFADVEFETSIIPIWLLRADYNFDKKPHWLQDLRLQFIFNPNADFIPDQAPRLGNDDGGIWGPNIQGPYFKNLPGIGFIPTSVIETLPPPLQAMAASLPLIKSYIGSQYAKYEEPGRFKPEGFEYAVRLQGVVLDAMITLNYFYGRDNSPIFKSAPIPPKITTAYNGDLLLHTFAEGRYPLFRFVGGTISRDIPPLKASFLGGVAPVVRLEGFYAFSNTFSAQDDQYYKSNEVRAALGIDWKVKINALNPRAYFMISPQVFYRGILDYPSGTNLTYQGDILYKNTCMTSLMINTSYFHNKLTPSFFWMQDYAHNASMFRLQAVYDYSNKWRATIGAIFLQGNKFNQGFSVFNDKDQIYFKISYKW